MGLITKGLKPLFIHNDERLEEIRKATKRYMKAGLRVPIEWITEYNELLIVLRNYPHANQRSKKPQKVLYNTTIQWY